MTTTIEQTIEPTPEHIGALSIRRYLPHRARQMVGPFIFMDQGGPLELPDGTLGGVPEHPHAGLSTFTYLMAGSVEHTDSAGNHGLIKPGDVALMTAGSGITHEEMPGGDLDPSEPRRLEFAQMWLALPDEVEESAPTFQHIKADELSTADLGEGSARIAIGSGWDVTAPTKTHTDTVFAEVNITAGGSITIEPTWEERALILLDGDAAVNDQPLKIHDLPILEPSSAVRLSSVGGARLLLFGGDRFGSDRYIAGSFVASDPDKIRNWMGNYSTGDFPRIDRTTSN